jgi:DNA repair and recombination protein RAD54B
MKDVLPTGSIRPSQDSGKLSVLQSLLAELHRLTSEKVVVVSNFTKTLDLLQALLQANNMTWCRLDGDTDPSKRQIIVDKFNSCDSKTCCTPPRGPLSPPLLLLLHFPHSPPSNSLGR